MKVTLYPPLCKYIWDFFELKVDDPLLKGGHQSPRKLVIEDPLLKGGPQHPEKLMIEDPLLNILES